MLSKDAYDSSIQFLSEALNWKLSDVSKRTMYERIASHWEDSALYDHALAFCDRGSGTPAQFLASLKQEKRLSQSSAPPPALPPAMDPAELPPMTQLRIWKMLALMKNGHTVDWELIEIDDRDMSTIRKAFSAKTSCIKALQNIHQKIGRGSALAAAIGEAF